MKSAPPMAIKPEPWFELTADGDRVRIQTFVPLHSDPEGEPGFFMVRVDRLKALNLAVSILMLLEREFRAAGAAFDVPGVVVEKISPTDCSAAQQSAETPAFKPNPAPVYSQCADCKQYRVVRFFPNDGFHCTECRP